MMTAKENFHKGIKDLKEMSKCHGFAIKGIEILGVLARKWGVDVDIQLDAETKPGKEKAVMLTSTASGSDVKGRDFFTADISSVDDIQDISGFGNGVENGASLFSPFPLQGRPVLLSAGDEGELERNGFVVRGGT
jgi:hypothetical protein